MSFKWGVEFETALLYYDKYGKNREVIWEKKDVKITSETWDLKLVHEPFEEDNKYWVTDQPEDDPIGKLFNIEAQLGVYSGFKGLESFKKGIEILDKKLKETIKSNQFSTKHKTIDMFTHTTYSESEKDDAMQYLFLDKSCTKPGGYKGVQSDYVGYRNFLLDDDIAGKPQLTMSFHLSYLPKLFEVYSDHYSYKTNEFRTDFANRIMAMWELKHTDATLHGFILYLCHYYNMYLNYKKYSEEYDYFKSTFFFKPRTNPASLYESLTAVQKQHLDDLLVIISEHNKRNQRSKKLFHHYLRFIERVMKQIKEAIPKKDCLYTKNLPNLPNSLYKYDTESMEIYYGIQNHSKQIKNISCIDLYEDENTDKRLDEPLPTLSYGEDEEFYISTGFTNAWEWPVTGKQEVAYEFRMLVDIANVSIELMDRDPKQYKELFTDHITPERLYMMIELIFESFVKYVFKDKPKTVKESIKQSSKKSEKSKESEKKEKPKKSIRKPKKEKSKSKESSKKSKEKKEKPKKSIRKPKKEKSKSKESKKSSKKSKEKKENPKKSIRKPRKPKSK